MFEKFSQNAKFFLNLAGFLELANQFARYNAFCRGFRDQQFFRFFRSI